MSLNSIHEPIFRDQFIFHSKPDNSSDRSKLSTLFCLFGIFSHFCLLSYSNDCVDCLKKNERRLQKLIESVQIVSTTTTIVRTTRKWSAVHFTDVIAPLRRSANQRTAIHQEGCWWKNCSPLYGMRQCRKNIKKQLLGKCDVKACQETVLLSFKLHFATFKLKND